MESDNVEVRVDCQEQTSVVQQNQTQTSDTDLRSVELGTAGTMDMLQIGVILMRLEELTKEGNKEYQRQMEGMERRLKESFKEHNEKFRITKIENLKTR